MVVDPKDVEFLSKDITNYTEGETIKTQSNKKIIILKVEKNAFGNFIVFTQEGEFYQVNSDKLNKITRFYPQEKWKF